VTLPFWFGSVLEPYRTVRGVSLTKKNLFPIGEIYPNPPGYARPRVTLPV